MKNLSIGSIGSPVLLSGDYSRRAAMMDQIGESRIDHLFIADHVSFHNGFGMDGLINAATLAAINTEIKIFLGVYLLALRHPVLVARQLSSLSHSAPGRIIFGVGLGGEDRHEMEVCGVDPSRRGLKTNECLKALTQLLSGESYSHHCEFFSFEDALIKPAPSPAIPIVIGGRSSAAIKRTALYGDGWLGVWCSPKRFAQAISEVETIAAENNRHKESWFHGLQIWVGFDDNKKKAREILAREMQNMYQIPFENFEKYCPYGSPEEVAEYLIPYVKNGATALNIKPCAVDDETEIEKVSEVCRLIRMEVE
jgi:alkanesulfonate monooxygenase SsuD/methylene tetrahydromethanopterin reductase-like flavin-dependent oxidoreductase (luciferase family)